MLDRLRAAARQKLQRAVTEVVEPRLDRSDEAQQARHDESLARLDALTKALEERLDALTKALEERLDAIDERFTAVHDRLAEMEFRARRDMWYALDATAARESATYALDHFPKARWFWHPHDTLRFALDEVKVAGLALEFGVATGTTLTIIAEALSADHTVVGFDTFTGLPETWRTGFPAGTFAQDKLPDCPAPASWRAGSRTLCRSSFPAPTNRSRSCTSTPTCTHRPRRCLTWPAIVWHPARWWCSTNSSTLQAGSSTSSGPGSSSSPAPGGDSTTSVTPATTNKSWSGCTDRPRQPPA